MQLFSQIFLVTKVGGSWWAIAPRACLRRKASLPEPVKDRVRNQIKKEGPREASVDSFLYWLDFQHCESDYD